MLVNNEVGTISRSTRSPLGSGSGARRCLVHTDAVQAVPWIDRRDGGAPSDLVADLGAQVRRPKGNRRARRARGVAIEPLLEGGGQERGLRSGTSNVAGAVAMAAALRVTCAERDADVVRIAALRDRLLDGLLATVPDAFENGARAAKVAGNAHVGFRGVRGRDAPRRARPGPTCARPRGRRARRAPPSRRTCSTPWASLAAMRSRRSA
jgi:cysteine desulfurase